MLFIGSMGKRALSTNMNTPMYSDGCRRLPEDVSSYIEESNSESSIDVGARWRQSHMPWDSESYLGKCSPSAAI